MNNDVRVVVFSSFDAPLSTGSSELKARTRVVLCCFLGQAVEVCRTDHAVSPENVSYDIAPYDFMIRLAENKTNCD